MRLRLRIAPLAIFLCTVASSLAAKTWTIPGVANTPGANGTFFVSDLTLTNTSDVASTVTLDFVPMSGGVAAAEQLVTLPAHASCAWTNLLQSEWGLENSGGAVSISSVAPLAIQARTYNTNSGGTYGLALPVITSSQMLRAGERGVSAWVTQSSIFRTNVGIVFPDSSGGSATVTLVNSSGAVVATRTYDTSMPAFFQDSLARWSTDPMNVARIAIDITRGRGYGYTAVADNKTGDSSVFPTDRIPSKATDLLISAAAHTRGANGTYYQTDLRIWNPSATAAVASAYYLPPLTDNSNAPAVTLSLAPGEVREVPDVLSSLFSVTEDTTGALRLTSPTPLVVLGRTSNVDPTHVNPASFGAQQLGIPVDSLLLPADGIVTLPELRLGGGYRTNIGFVAGATGASIHLDIVDQSGAVVSTRTTSLLPFAWSQASAASLFDVPPAVFSGTARLRVDSGSVTSYTSVVDQLSGDASVGEQRCEACVTPVVIAAPDALCSSVPAILSVDFFQGASYDWSVNGATVTSGAGTSSVTIQPSTASMSATVVVRHGAYSSDASISRSVASTASIDNVSITPPSVGTSTTLHWTLSAPASSVTLTGSDLSSPVVLPGTATSYSYVPSTSGAKNISISAAGVCGGTVQSLNYSVSNSSTIFGAGSSGGGGRQGVVMYPGASGRQYLVFVPAGYDPAEPIPVVFAWGGQGESAEMTIDWEWGVVAQRDNVIVVTMTASSSGPGYSGAYDQPEFDTIELAELQVPRLYNIAVKHEYLWGFSAGAHVSYAFGLATEGSNRFAAMAIQAGAIEAFATHVDPPSWPPQAGARRIPVYISCGTADTSGSGGGLIGALRRNRDMLLAEGYPVVTREVAGQGHTYTSADVEAAWSFLKANTLP